MRPLYTDSQVVINILKDACSGFLCLARFSFHLYFSYGDRKTSCNDTRGWSHLTEPRKYWNRRRNQQVHCGFQACLQPQLQLHQLRLYVIQEQNLNGLESPYLPSFQWKTYPNVHGSKACQQTPTQLRTCNNNNHPAQTHRSKHSWEWWIWTIP